MPIQSSYYPTPVCCLLLLAGAIPNLAGADVLWMKNGDRLSGKIEAVADDTIKIRVAYAPTLTIQRDQVARWRIDGMDNRKLQRLPAPDTTAAKEESFWHHTASGDLSAKLKRNGSRRDDINLVADGELANHNWRYTLHGDYNYETSDGETQSHDYKLNPKVDYFLNQQWFWRTAMDYNYDLLSSNYLSIEYGSGPGYRFWNDRQRRLEWILQAGLSKSYWEVGSSNLDLLFDNGRANYPFVSLGWDYKQPLFDKSVEAFSTGTYFRYLHQPSAYVNYAQSAELNLGMRYYLTNHLRISWRSELDWEDLQIDYAGQALRPKNDLEWRHYLSLGATY